MSDFRKKIEESLEELGVVYNEATLNKCCELSTKHGFNDVDELVDSWMAFSVSNLRGENPTPQHLARFEREFLAQKSKQKERHHDSSRLNDLDPEPSPTYSRTPKRNPKTPDVSRSRLAISPRGGFSPASFSPVTGTPSLRYAGRNNPGSVVCEKTATCVTAEFLPKSVTVKRLENVLTSADSLMAFHLTDCAEAAQIHMAHVISLLTEKFSLDDPVPLKTKHATDVLVAGRIMCDADGRLNAESLMLEASPEAGGEVIRLDLSAVPSYSVFPGQVVAIEGINVSGHKMIAKKLWSDGSVTIPPPKLSLQGGMKIMVACGPFTTKDSLDYQPLIDFLAIVVKEEPHVLLLTGPLVDENHPAIASLLIAEKFEDMFDRLLSEIMEPLNNLKTEVVLVSSYRECHGPAVFPTLPIPSRQHPRLTIVPDPSVISVEGLIIGITSVDIIMHIGQEEVEFPQHSGDRLVRLASHVMHQQSFYPLRPSSSTLPLDPRLERHLALPITPHLLILPSDLRYFMREVNGCTILNPDHLAKGLVGGTYAILTSSTTGVISGQIIKV